MKQLVMGLLSGILLLTACGEVPTAQPIQNTAIPTIVIPVATATLSPTAIPPSIEGSAISPVTALAIDGIPSGYGGPGTARTGTSLSIVQIPLNQVGYAVYHSGGTANSIVEKDGSRLCIMSAPATIYSENPQQAEVRLGPAKNGIVAYGDSDGIDGVSSNDIVHSQVATAVQLTGFPDNLVCVMAQANEENADGYKPGSLRILLYDKNTRKIVGDLSGWYSPADEVKLQWTARGPQLVKNNGGTWETLDFSMRADYLASFTETPLPPQIDMLKYVAKNPDGSIVLTSWNSPKVDVNLPYDQHLQVQELEKLLSAPSWTPQFIDNWHAYLTQAEVNGIKVVQPFDPNTVCNVKWIQYTGGSTSRPKDQWAIEQTTCSTGTFPFRLVGLFFDGRPTIKGANGETLRMSVIGVTAAIWNPTTRKTELRTYAISEVFDNGTNTVKSLAYEGSYLVPNYKIKQELPNQYFLFMMDWFAKLDEQNRSRQNDPQYPAIYDPVMVDEAFNATGLFDERLNHTVIFGSKGAIPVMSPPSSP